MFKKIVTTIVVFSFTVFSSNLSYAFGGNQEYEYINIEANTTNPNRKVNLEEELLVVISSDEKRPYGIETENGKIIIGLLSPNTVVVVDRETGLAKWVFGHGNNIKNDIIPIGAKIEIRKLFEGAKGDFHPNQTPKAQKRQEPREYEFNPYWLVMLVAIPVLIFFTRERSHYGGAS